MLLLVGPGLVPELAQVLVPGLELAPELVPELAQVLAPGLVQVLAPGLELVSHKQPQCC